MSENKEIGIKVYMQRGRNFGKPRDEAPVKFPVYKSDPPGISRHPRRIAAYVWTENGSTFVEDAKTGKVTMMNLP